MPGLGKVDFACDIDCAVVLFNGSTDAFEDLAILDNVVPVIAGGDISNKAAVVQPDAVSPPDFLPVIKFFVMAVDRLTFGFRKVFCSFVEFLEVVEFECLVRN